MILATFSSCCCYEYEFWLPFPAAAADAFAAAAGLRMGKHRGSEGWMVFSYPDQQQQQKLLQHQEEKVAKIFIFIAAARGKSSQNHHFLWVSEVTLGISGVQFWGFSVLHCHGVFLSGD